MRVFGRPIALFGVVAFAVLGVGTGPAAADTVVLTLSATIGANGTTISVVAPGCQPTAPENFPDIFLQSRNSTTGEIGEGAVATGGFSAAAQGSVVIPPGTPGSSFLVSVSCNGGALKGSQVFVLATPATPVASQPSFTG